MQMTARKPHVGLAKIAITSLTALVALVFAGSAQAQTAVGMGTAETFAILAGAGVTNTGPSVINGDLGTAPTPSVTGFGGAPSGTVNGAIHQANAVANQAKIDLTTAYNNAAGQGPATHPCDAVGRTEPDHRRLQLSFRDVQHHRAAHPRRAGRPQRRLHLPDREHARHRVRVVGPDDQRWPVVQCVLAGWILGNPRLELRLPRQRLRRSADLGRQWRDRRRAPSRPDRERHSRQQHRDPCHVRRCTAASDSHTDSYAHADADSDPDASGRRW